MSDPDRLETFTNSKRSLLLHTVEVTDICRVAVFTRPKTALLCHIQKDHGGTQNFGRMCTNIDEPGVSTV